MNADLMVHVTLDVVKAIMSAAVADIMHCNLMLAWMYSAVTQDCVDDCENLWCVCFILFGLTFGPQ